MQPIGKHNNFIFFTISLVILLLTSAVAHTLPARLGTLLSHLITLATFVVAYVTLSFGPNWHRFVGTLVVLGVLANTVGEFLHKPTGELSRHLVALVFFLGAAYNAAQQVLLSPQVKTNVIVGAMAIYLLLGLIWASLYALVLLFEPEALHGLQLVEETSDFPKLLYFSYVTLTTLGYGDISPAMPLTRTLAYLEAITGTFYLAIVVASLIGARRHN
ncbi:MAG: two pore domain potassium channel family protein [Pseudomonadales bacterium]|nr:two pore domain potassium channel family protein [Pseudomonadales bacterium]